MSKGFSLMHLKYRNLKVSLLAYLVLPIIIFIIGYLRLYIAIPAAACIVFGFVKACGDNTSDRFTKELTIGRWQFMLLAVIILLWTHLGGLNGLFYQSDDWPWRNAIFHDLVDMKWPVVYENRGSALVYYIGFWLPPAVIAKFTAFITGSAIWTWRAARGALWIWSSLGLMLTALTLMFFVNADKRWKQWAVVAVFILFSGLDIIGAVYTEKLQRLTAPARMHLEWWPLDKKQFSSITTCIYWVFNQSIIPWLATACFLMEKNAKNYVFLGVTCMCSGPLPFVGLVICMVFSWICDAVKSIRSRQLKNLAKETLSASNILLAGIAITLLGIYFISNMSFMSSALQKNELRFIDSVRAYFNRNLIVFYALEVGVYIVLIWHRHLKNPMFYCIAASLLIIPYFHIGASEDFCMRASIPALFILMAYCAEYLTNELPKFRKNGLFKKAAAVAILCALTVGAATPAMEIYRGIYHAITQKTIQLAQDTFGSIGALDDAENFTAAEYENTLFFKYLARRR